MKKITSVGKAQQLYSILRNHILNGDYAEGEKLPSIRELASEYQLSKNTVNIVFAMLVNEGLVTIREGNGTYVSIESLPKSAKMIGMLSYDLTRSNMYVDIEILGCVQRNIPRNYYLSLYDTSDCFKVFCEGLEQLYEMGVAGYLIIPPKGKPKSEHELDRAQKLIAQRPTVFINRGINGIEADLYSMDLGKGIVSAFEYLVLNQRSHIAMVLHDSEKFETEELRAYQTLLQAHGLAMKPEYLIPWSNDISSIRNMVEKIVFDIDALIAPDNVLAQLMDMFAQTGRTVPDMISLVGINDTVFSRMINPPLTSIAFPVERIGRSAVSKLLGRIDGMDTTPPKTWNFKPELIIRGT